MMRRRRRRPGPSGRLCSRARRQGRLRLWRSGGRAAPLARGALADERGQMCVELAVLVPVIVVFALVLVNLMGFVEACAAFDQAALDAVVAHGVAPSGEQTTARCVEEVSEAIELSLGRQGRCEVSVRAESASAGAAGTFAVSPLLTRYVCTLTYRPWPRTLRLPLLSLEAPVTLRHERELVVDRYRCAVVV